MLPDANLRHQEALDCAKGQKAEADFRVPFCPHSFDQAQADMVLAEWYDLQLTTLATRVQPLMLPWICKVW